VIPVLYQHFFWFIPTPPSIDLLPCSGCSSCFGLFARNASLRLSLFGDWLVVMWRLSLVSGATHMFPRRRCPSGCVICSWSPTMLDPVPPGDQGVRLARHTLGGKYGNTHADCPCAPGQLRVCRRHRHHAGHVRGHPCEQHLFVWGTFTTLIYGSATWGVYAAIYHCS